MSTDNTNTKQQQIDAVWQTVQRARHPQRPKASQFINSFKDFDQLHGDRMFGDCQAIIGGTALFNNTAVMVMGQEKGHDTQSRIKHNLVCHDLKVIAKRYDYTAWLNASRCL